MKNDFLSVGNEIFIDLSEYITIFLYFPFQVSVNGQLMLIDFRGPNGLELQVSPSPSPGLKCGISKLRVDLDRP